MRISSIVSYVPKYKVIPPARVSNGVQTQAPAPGVETIRDKPFAVKAGEEDDPSLLLGDREAAKPGESADDESIGAFSRVLRPTYTDRKAARRSMDAILARDFDRIILAHGAVIDSGGQDALRGAYAWL